MYKNELDRHIQNKTLSNNFILFGESDFFIDRYTKSLSDVSDASVIAFYHDEYDFTAAKAHLSNASLFGDRNVLIVKSEKKIPKKELETLIELCEKNSDNLFIYAYYGSDHKSYSNGVGKKSTMAVRFFHPKRNEAIHFLMHEAKERRVQIDSHAITHLLEIHNQNISLASNELEKLSIFDREVTTKEINELVYGLAEVNIEEFMKKVLQKKDFKLELQNLLEHGEEEIRLITALSGYITTLYLFNIYIREHGVANAKEILGYSPPQFIVDEKARESMRIKMIDYYKVLDLLTQSELQMKSSGNDKESILLSTLIKIQKIL
ncbi:MAG: DNA polymerase III subunit delta [Epsilonproteobacteria bacterium]|nr:DNA polymerase III subunit delta [Campylobacterota bacterium]